MTKSKKRFTIKERLIVIETLMNNHLKHHEMWMKFLLAPILVVVIATLVTVAIK